SLGLVERHEPPLASDDSQGADAVAIRVGHPTANRLMIGVRQQHVHVMTVVWAGVAAGSPRCATGGSTGLDSLCLHQLDLRSSYPNLALSALVVADVDKTGLEDVLRAVHGLLHEVADGNAGQLDEATRRQEVQGGVRQRLIVKIVVGFGKPSSD